MKKIAIVCQRYGLEVNGGAEYYARLMAEKLSAFYEVEVLTSKALSYERWADHYTADVEQIHGVRVRRFGVARERRPFLMKILSNLIKRLHMNWRPLCDLWVDCQGPYVPELVRYIEEHQADYEAFLFVTYLYYPTVVGMAKAGEKAIFIPTAHDEPYIYFKSHQPLFTMPRGIVYLTEEEKTFVERVFHNEDIPSVVAGVGVDLPPQVDPAAFRAKYGIEGDYLVYVGRVDRSKGCGEMTEYFLRLLEDHPQLQLVMMGQAFMELPQHPNIRYLGFVPEQDKFDGIAGAKALWLPSQFESLSIAVLEAMSLGVPVLVNGKCEVLKGHCLKSDGGLYYEDDAACRTAVGQLLSDERRRQELGEKARNYVEKYYRWPQIMGQVRDLIEGTTE